MQKPVIEVDTIIGVDAGAVWKAMTGKQSAMFPGAKVETDWKVGHPISFSGDWKGKPFKDHGEIQTLKEKRELSFSHWSETGGKAERPENYHIVRYELEPEGSKTRVTLSQINMGPKQEIDAKTKAEFTKNWTMMLEGLKQAAEAN